MKKVIIILIILQLAIISSIGLAVFNQAIYQSIFYTETSIVQLGVSNIEQYNTFLDVLAENNITAIRKVNPNEDTLILYTNDLTLNNKVHIKEGRFPNNGEFISNLRTNQAEQSGVIKDIIPDTNLFIYNLDIPENLYISSFYYLNTIDKPLVDSIVDSLVDNVYHIEQYDTLPNQKFLGLLESLSINQIALFFISNVFLFLTIIQAILQYINSQAKNAYVFFLHGYSKPRVAKELVFELFDWKYLCFGIIFIYLVLSSCSVFINSYSYYFYKSFLFLLITLALVFIYTFITFIFVVILFNNKKYTSINILKGKRPYRLVQINNIIIKSIFIIFFIIGVFVSTTLINKMIEKNDALKSWEITKNIYRLEILDVGQINDFMIEEYIIERIENLYQHLVSENNAFIINSTNFETMESLGVTGYGLESLKYGIASELYISPNYLKFNPIFDKDGLPISEKIIYSPNVLNVIVPSGLEYEQAKILSYFEDYYYFMKVKVANIYNTELGRPLNKTSKDDLSVNIIFAEDNQNYFTFNPELRVSNGNLILDPIVVVYTGSVHPSFLYSNATHSLFFYTESLNPNENISNILGDNSIVSSTISLFDINRDKILKLKSELITTVILLIGIIMANVGISCNLFTNYFENNKYELIIKAIWGFNQIRRYKKIILILFIPTIVLSIIFSIIFSVKTLFICIFLLAIDIVCLFYNERKLQSKLFKNILKGEYL